MDQSWTISAWLLGGLLIAMTLLIIFLIYLTYLNHSNKKDVNKLFERYDKIESRMNLNSNYPPVHEIKKSGISLLTKGLPTQRIVLPDRNNPSKKMLDQFPIIDISFKHAKPDLPRRFKTYREMIDYLGYDNIFLPNLQGILPPTDPVPPNAIRKDTIQRTDEIPKYRFYPLRDIEFRYRLFGDKNIKPRYLKDIFEYETTADLERIAIGVFRKTADQIMYTYSNGMHYHYCLCRVCNIFWAIFRFYYPEYFNEQSDDLSKYMEMMKRGYTPDMMQSRVIE